MLTNTRILIRLAALTGFLLAMLLAVGGACIISTLRNGDGLRSVYEDHFISHGQLGGILNGYQEIQRDLLSLIALRDPALIASRKNDIAKQGISARKQWNNLLGTFQLPEEKPLVEATKKSIADYHVTLDKARALLAGPDIGAARSFINRQGRASFDVLDKNLYELMLVQQKIGGREYARAKALDANIHMLLIFLLGIALMGGTLLAWWINRSITRPLTLIIGVMQKLTGGDLTIDIPGQERGDEIGDLARAVVIFKDSMIEAENLRRREDNFRISATLNAAFEALPATVAVMDSKASILFTDKKLQKVIQGMSARFSEARANYFEAVGELFKEDPQTRSALIEGVRGVLEGRRNIFTVECDFATPRARRRLMITGTPLPVQGGGAVVMTLDITERTKIENELKIRNEAMNAALTPITIADMAGNFTYVNQAFLDVWGFKNASEILGQNGESLWDEKIDFDRASDEFLEVGFLTREMPAKRRDGSLAQLLVMASVVKSPDGTPLSVISSYLDMTKRIAMEKALRESEQYTRMLFDASPTGLALSRLDGSFVSVNSAFARILGRGMDEIMTLDYGRITPEEYRAQDARQLQTLNKMGRFGPYDKEIIHKDGHRVSVRLNDILVEQGGEVLVWSSVEDISESKKAEILLRESEQYNRALFETSPIGLALSLRDGTFLDVNSAYAMILGMTVDEVKASNRISLTPKEYTEIDERGYETLMSTGRYGPLEKEYFRADGKRVPVRVQGSMIEISGETCIWSSIEDITEQRKIDEQLRQSLKLQSIGTLAGGISHEINNLLMPIVGLTELVRDNTKDERNIANLDDILAATERIRLLVSTILAFSRRNPLNRHIVALAPAIEKIFELMRVTLPSNVQILFDIEPRLQVSADESQIQQVIMNLCSNAVHAMGLKGGKLRISARSYRPGAMFFEKYFRLARGPYVKIMVADTGHGMNAEMLSRIFEPFFTTKEVGEGTGLGLSVVHGIIESHGGVIEVESKIGVGTCFSIYLPAASAAKTGTKPAVKNRLAN